MNNLAMNGAKDKNPLEVLQLAFKSRRLSLFANHTGIPVEAGELVVVTVDRGEDMGVVTGKLSPDQVPLDSVEGELVRLPTDEDIKQYQDNREFEKRVLEHCAKRVKVRNLDMRLTDCEAQLDRNRIRIFFTADQRTDFRGLVRDMASAFRARIEMRQIGVRDDAKHKDGVGICGRRLCCSGFLNEFRSVTLKAVREQGLSPNPSKVSGACSRLMCCLEYETDLYRKAARTFPREGARMKLVGRQVLIKKSDIFRDTVTVQLENDEEEVMDIEEFHRRRTMPAAEPAAENARKAGAPAQKAAKQESAGPREDGKAPRKHSRGRRRHKKKSRKEERKS